MRQKKEAPDRRGPAEACSIVVAYEDTVSRDQALGLCDNIVRQFGDDIRFHFSWWKFEFLADPDISTVACRALRDADMLIVSAHAGRDWPERFKEWLETALGERAAPERALAALVGTETDQRHGMSPRHNYLRNVARQAGMDYLAHVVEQPGQTMPDSLGEAKERADQITPVLDRILHLRAP